MSAAEAADLARQRAESKKRKQQFLIFIKALMRDLAQMDPAMHAKAKAIIQDCTDKKKRRVTGFDFERTMRTRLLETVGESNWRRVERDLHRRPVARKAEPKQHRLCSTDISFSSDSSTASFSLTSNETETEVRPEKPEPSVTTSISMLKDLSLSHDGSVEVEVVEAKREKKERPKAQAKVVQKPHSRPPAAVVVPEEQRFIYI